MGHSKLVSPLGTQLWKLSDLFQFCVIEESRASEGWKIKFFKREILRFWELNSNFWAKTIYKSSLNFWNRLIVVVTRPNLEIDTTQNSKFSKFGLMPQLHSFPWLKTSLTLLKAEIKRSLGLLLSKKWEVFCVIVQDLYWFNSSLLR